QRVGTDKVTPEPGQSPDVAIRANVRAEAPAQPAQTAAPAAAPAAPASAPAPVAAPPKPQAHSGWFIQVGAAGATGDAGRQRPRKVGRAHRATNLRRNSRVASRGIERILKLPTKALYTLRTWGRGQTP